LRESVFDCRVSHFFFFRAAFSFTQLLQWKDISLLSWILRPPPPSRLPAIDSSAPPQFVSALTSYPICRNCRFDSRFSAAALSPPPSFADTAAHLSPGLPPTRSHAHPGDNPPPRAPPPIPPPSLGPARPPQVVQAPTPVHPSSLASESFYHFS